MASIQLDQLRMLLRCCVCESEKANHKQLPCQHTVCEDCLIEIVGEETNKIQCPACSKECLVPNGGVAGFPNSLITRQVADILKPTQSVPEVDNKVEKSKSTASTVLKKTETSPKKKPSEDERVRALINDSSKRVQLRKELEKLAANAHAWTEHTRTKMTMLSDDLATLPSSCQAAKNELQANREKLKAEYQRRIKELDEKAKVKIDDVQKHRSDREEEIESWLRETEPKLCQVQDTMRDAEVVLKGISNKNANAARLGRALEKVDSLRSYKLLPADQREWREFCPGDSCRLNVVPADMEQSLEAKASFSKIGRIVRIVKLPQGGYLMDVIFPDDKGMFYFTWTGGIELLSKSLTESPVPMVDMRVRFKAAKCKSKYPSDEMINLQRQLYKDKTEGWLVQIHLNQTADNLTTADAIFPDRVCWTGLLDNLEKVEGPTIKSGDKVWIHRRVTKPSHGFNGVTRSSCGVVTSINDDDDVIVDFPECSSWKGKASELRGHVVPLESMLAQVSLHTSLTDVTKWKGLTHKDVGMVTKIREGFNHKGQKTKLATVRFKETGDLECELSEIEVAMQNDTTEYEKKIAKQKSTSDQVGLPEFDPVLFQQLMRGMAQDENMRQLFKDN